MKHKIKGGSLFETRSLALKPDKVLFAEGVIFASQRKFNYSEIEYVLLGKDNVLSFQVGQQIFRIPVRPGNTKDQAAISYFVEQMQLNA